MCVDALLVAHTLVSFACTQVVVILMFLIVLAISAVGVSQLKQEFRREWFLPQDSYVQEHYAVSRAEFSQLGISVSVYIANVEDPFESRAALGSAITVLQDSSFIDRSLPFTDWYSDFELYMQVSEGGWLSVDCLC